tara:strand:- start:8141 stop:9415 length:1275 start_codon:yes stop_codon:yes gene_type:complete
MINNLRGKFNPNNKKKGNKIYLRFFIFIFHLIIVYKALNTQISFDEAYTFLQYVYTDDILNFGLANNHLLNTFLMYSLSFIDYDLFLLRLPNLIFGSLYLLSSYYISLKVKYRYLTLTILICSPYLIDFFSIARGYGISAALTLIGLTNYYFSNYKYKMQISLFLFILSSYSIHITIILLFVFILFNFDYFIYKLNTVKILSLIFTVVLSTPVIYLVFNITNIDKPLYGVEDISFLYLIKSSFGFNGLYVSDTTIFNLFLNSLFISPLIFFQSHTLKTKRVIGMTYLTVLLLYLLPFIFGRPFPIYRVLIPFLPMVLFSLVLTIDSIFNRFYFKYQKSFSFIVGFIILFNFLGTLQFNDYFDWDNFYDKELQISFSQVEDSENCIFDFPDELRDPSTDYYRLIASIEKPIYCDYDTKRIGTNAK